MQKAKKICCQITPRRIIGAILLAATAVNLVIVGAAFEVTFPVPTVTKTQTNPPVTVVLSPTVRQGNTTLRTATVEASTPTPTFTLTSTPTLTPTVTATSTFTDTPSPSPTLCVPIYAWPVYVVQRGDWLQAIAGITGSSVAELIRANCLVDTVIYPGQELHVPRLPITPTFTATTFTNRPTDFKLAEILSCDAPYYVSVAVSADDPEGILFVVVRFYTAGDLLISEMTMEPNGSTYSVDGFISQQFTVDDIDYYKFSAIDGLQDVTVSASYTDRASSCVPPVQAGG
jgi:LysM repeat protein